MISTLLIKLIRSGSVLIVKAMATLRLLFAPPPHAAERALDRTERESVPVQSKSVVIALNLTKPERDFLMFRFRQLPDIESG